jgi:hypothetical protein|tara:strand:- start:3405 stop:3665 length:261 start_codon:yes stop_codon:yes gene_type:complete
MTDKIKDKGMLQSKKFIASMLWNFAWLILIWVGIRNDVEASVLVPMIYAAGATQMLYLGGQSAVDAFVRATFMKYSSTTIQPKVDQ